MFTAADVHYPSSGGARAALVLASDAAFSTIESENTVLVGHVAPYQPGEFYRRELRGSATRPLYVTSAGITPAEAASLVAAMSGKFRLPDALRRTDALARGRY